MASTDSRPSLRAAPLLLVFLLLVPASGCAPAGAATAPPPTEAGTAFRFEHWPPGEAAARGRAVYDSNCAGCHGSQGRGDGPASVWLDPLPRDFQAGSFKFRSTPSGELPTEDDVVHVVRCGLVGSSMPAFPLLSETAVRDVAAWVLYLATFGLLRDEVEDLMEDDGLLPDEVVASSDFPELLAEVLEDAYEDVWPVAVPPDPGSSPALVARGGQLYAAQCAACHGERGRGDGPSSFTLRDGRDARILPRDFTTGIFRAGSTPRDLFLRMKTGVNGTPMPSYETTPDDDLWALVHFILSLSADGGARPHPTSCEAHRRRALPAAPVSTGSGGALR